MCAVAYFIAVLCIFLCTPDGHMAAGMLLSNWLVGALAVFIFCRKELRGRALSLFSWILLGYCALAVGGHIYRIAQDYEFIGSLDGFEVYLPYTEELLYENRGFFSVVKTIYTTSAYSFVGSILLLFMLAGLFSQYCQGDMLYALQLSLIGMAALVPIVVYHLFLKFDFSEKKSYCYALLFAFFTSCFYQSSFVVRDMPITLAYTAMIYLYFDEFKWATVIKMILLLGVVASLRMASAAFAVLFIGGYLFNNMGDSSLFKKMGGIICFLLFVAGGVLMFSDISALFEDKIAVYGENELADQGGASTLSMFNILPPGISHFCKVLYDQFSPYPCFRGMVSFGFRPECYNLTRWPDILSTPFRYFLLTLLIMSFVVYADVRRYIAEKRDLVMVLLIGILFLALQSSTMGDRRKLGVYAVFFLAGMLGWEKMNSGQRKCVVLTAGLVFLSMQVLGTIVMYRI